MRDMSHQNYDKRHIQQELDRLKDYGFRRNGDARDVGRQMAGSGDDEDLIRKLNDLEHYMT